MMLAMFLFLATFAWAQGDDRARALLQDIASSARSTKSWRAEGVEINELTGDGLQLRDELRFKIAIQGPAKMRWETSGDDDTFMVCDGTDHWTYYSHGPSFHRSSVGVSPCEPALGNFLRLTDNLIAAMQTGRDQVQFAGNPRECDLVRAEYAVPGSQEGGKVRSVVRTLCIDAAQRLILRDNVETTVLGVRSNHTVIYSLYERDPKLSPDVFEFMVPTGTFEDEGPLLGGDDALVQNGVYPIGSGVSIPTLDYKIEPTYTQEASLARVSGMVLVSLAVDPSGKPQNVSVFSGLGYGLDERAIEAVGQWRFQPGMKDGVSVPVGMLKVVVNFRLP
jgi:TonB family protein